MYFQNIDNEALSNYSSVLANSNQKSRLVLASAVRGNN